MGGKLYQKADGTELIGVYSHPGVRQGLTLVNFTPQPELFRRHFVTETAQLIPEPILGLS